MKYSIIIPCYNEEDNIEPLYWKLDETLSSSFNFDIIFVDDGSSDETLKKIKSLQAQDHRVQYLSLLTNSGHQKALFAGLCSCQSDIAITMDADLQHPPELIPELIKKHHQTGAQIVVGKRKGRQKGILKNIFSNSFYRLFNAVTGIYLQPGISDFRLYSRKSLDIICNIKEREPFLRGMITQLGIKSAIIEYELKDRNIGKPAYTLSKSLRMGINALFRFSKLPAKIAFFTAIIGICLSLFQATHYIYLRLFTDLLVPGQADLMVLLSLLGSMILLILSLLLHTIMHLMDTIQGKPIYIIKEKLLKSAPIKKMPK